MTTPAPPTPADRSIGQLVSDLSEQTSRLVRAEIDLAKAEITGRLKLLAAGSGMLIAGGVVALYLFAAVLATAIIALALVVDLWLAALIVTVLLALVTGLLVWLGVRALKKGAPPTPARALKNVPDDIAAVKEGLA